MEMTFSLIGTIEFIFVRFFMARKGILPRRKRGRASTAPIDIEEVNTSPHQRQNIANDVESSNINTLDNSQS